MTYPYHPRESWMKPPYQRSPLKRRCSSPSLFPRKVHVSEEKVAEELRNLSLCNTESRFTPKFSSESQKPDFLLDGTRRHKTFKEIEDSIEIDGLGDTGNDNFKGTVQFSPELESEIKKMSRKILTASSYRLSNKRLPVNPCQELVLWKPPSGSIVEVLNALKEAAALTHEVDDDYHVRSSCPRLDRIEEESRSELEECSMSDFTDELTDSNLPKPMARTYGSSSLQGLGSSSLQGLGSSSLQGLGTSREADESFDDSFMETSMEL